MSTNPTTSNNIFRRSWGRVRKPSSTTPESYLIHSQRLCERITDIYCPEDYQERAGFHQTSISHMCPLFKCTPWYARRNYHPVGTRLYLSRFFFHSYFELFRFKGQKMLLALFISSRFINKGCQTKTVCFIAYLTVILWIFSRHERWEYGVDWIKSI